MKKFNDDISNLLINTISIIIAALSIIVTLIEYSNSNILFELNSVLNNNKDLFSILITMLSSIIAFVTTYLAFSNEKKKFHMKEEAFKNLFEQLQNYKETIYKTDLKEVEYKDYMDEIIENYTIYYASSKKQGKTKFISKLLTNKNKLFNLLVLLSYIIFTLIILTIAPEQVNTIANSFIDTFKQICIIVENNQSLIAVLTAGCTLYAGILAYNYSRKKEKNDEKKQAIDCIETILNYLYSNFDNINTVFNPNWSTYVNFIDDIDLKLDIIHILHNIEIGNKSCITKSSIQLALFRLNKSNISISNPVQA